MDRSPAALRRAMVEGQAARGIHDPSVLAAMGAVPREEFVPDRYRSAAYEERPLPLPDGQTISQPWVVAAMTQLLALSGTEKVLEVGTGSGYQAAVLRRIVPRVVTLERHARLAEAARRRFEALGIDGIEVHVGDGSLGWAPEAPYDAVIVTAAAPEIPATLVAQLAPGGRLVVPVGARSLQRLTLVERSASGEVLVHEGDRVAFVPLVGDEGWPTG